MSQVKFKSHAAGMYKIEAVKRDGARRVLADWFPNLITDQGLNRMGTNNDYLNWCQVGTGSSAPSSSDTALSNRVAGTNTTQSNTSGNQSSPPYYAWNTRVFRFAEGVASGNLSEVGVGWSSTGNLFSRALILDAQGSPTSITVLSDESLDVTYQFRMYPPTEDISGIVLIGGINRSFVSRAANVTLLSSSTGWVAQDLAGSTGISGSFPQSVFNGDVGSITSSPSGTSSGRSSVSAASYVNNSLERSATATWGLDRGNLSGGISAVQFKLGHGMYQFSIDPPIAKTDSDIFSLTVTWSWARKAL